MTVLVDTTIWSLALRRRSHQLAPLVQHGLFPSRSKLIQDGVGEKLQRLRWVRLAQECAKLRPEVERAEAEEFFASEAEWPEY